MSLNLDKSRWTRVAFGDVIESITDRVDDPSSAVDRYVGLEHLDPGVMTVQRWDSPDKVEAQKLRFQPGDVIFGRRRAYQKKVARAEFEGICSAHALVLRAHPGRMTPDFLPVFLSSDYFLDRAIAISVGSLSPTVNWRDLKVQEFDLPPLDEQQRLAELLWAIEHHRASLQAEWAVIRRERSRHVDEVVGDAVARVARPLCELADIRGGIQKGKRVDGDSLELPYLRVANVQGGWLDLAEMKTLPVSPADAIRYALQDGDVLMTEGGDIDKLGRGTVWRAPIDRCLHQNHVFAVRANLNVAIPEWLSLHTEATHGRSYFRVAAKRTSNLASVNKTQVSAFPIGAISVHEQRSAIERVAVFDGALAALQVEINRSIHLSATITRAVLGRS